MILAKLPLQQTLIPIFTLAALFCMSTSASSQNKKKKIKIPATTELKANIEYAKRGELSMLLDLYIPKNVKNSDKKLPVLVYIHGGGWLKGSKDKIKGTWITEHGYILAAINYRLIPHKWPAQIDDCRSAIRFLRSNAEKYNIAPDKIAVWGTSAGGHLAALMGTQSPPKDEKISSKVQAAIDWFGPTDLLTMPPNVVSEKRTLEDVRKSNGAKLLGAAIVEVPELAKQASAYWHVTKDDPPFLIMHGDKDHLPIEQSLKLHKKQKELGAPTQLHIVKGAGHGGPLFESEESRKVMLEFLDKHLKK